MASEASPNEQSEAFVETKPRETKACEEVGSLKRSFEGNSDFQPEPKKLAMSSECGSNDSRSSSGKSGPTSHQQQQQQPLNSAQNNGNGQGNMTEQIFVPDRMVGLLIGKGGEQITSIQNECQCRIQFAPETGAPQRQCTLSGPIANVQKAKKVIDDIIMKSQLVSLGGEEVEYQMPIPGNKVGLIIGKNGDTIKQLQEKSGVRIAVIQDNTQPTDFDKPLRITGNKAGVQKARELVLELVNEHDRSGGGSGSGGSSGPRSGFVGGGGGGGSKINIEIPVPRSTVGVIIGRNGEMIKKIQEESGSKVQFRPDDIDDNGPNRVCHIYGHKANNEHAVAAIHELIKRSLMQNRSGAGGDFSPFQGGPSPFGNGTLHGIPADKCGLVIGKGGENIKEINRVSGAHAELLRDNGPDPSVKRFKVSGTPEQIQHCIQLINDKAGLPNSIMGGHLYGGLQGAPGGPPMVTHFPALNMPGPAGSMVASFQGQTQVVLPNQAIYGTQVQQGAAQWQNQAAGYPQAAAAPFNQQQAGATVVVDPSKGSDPNAAAWAAYYAQIYSGAGAPGGQQIGGPQQAVGSVQQGGGLQAVQAGQVGGPGGNHPTVAYTTQVIQAPVQAAAQPQPTINPLTGQHDYSLAWAEYYRAQGLHQQAAAIMQGVGLPSNQ